MLLGFSMQRSFCSPFCGVRVFSEAPPSAQRGQGLIFEGGCEGLDYTRVSSVLT